MNRLKAVMLHLIANEAPLGPEHRDHALKGTWANHRECHVGGDFLLIYQVEDAPGPSGSINFVRAGTHTELFE
jgi:mRNA interferase YafQ